MRPTHGRVDDAGVVPLSHSFDTVGWFAKDAKTLRVMGDVLLEPDSKDAETSAKLGKARMAMCSDVSGSSRLPSTIEKSHLADSGSESFTSSDRELSVGGGDHSGKRIII